MRSKRKDNHKKDGDFLRKKIVKYFVLCSFGVAVVESAVDSTFDDIIMPAIYAAQAEYRNFGILPVLYLGVSFLLFFVGAFFFYRLTKKAIEEESRRQLKSQNLIYSAITHDLKTPMTSIQGFAAALRDGKIKSEEQQDIFDIIYKKSGYMNEMIDSLFEYSKLGTGEYKLRSEQFDAACVVREVAAENYSEFEDKGILVDVDISETPIMICGDEQEFRRAVSNLVINAWKHNDEGVRVLIAAMQKDGEAYISVADSGENIPEGMRDVIFDPFITQDEARTSGKGNGLGLAISAKIVGMMGGKICVEDCVGGYTKAFVVKVKII